MGSSPTSTAPPPEDSSQNKLDFVPAALDVSAVARDAQDQILLLAPAMSWSRPLIPGMLL